MMSEVPTARARLVTIQDAPDQVHDGQLIRAAHLHCLLADGRPAAIYTAVCLPTGPGPHPVVIHCPGGTQTVDPADLVWWSRQGFACVSFDWQCGFYSHHDPARKSCWPPGVAIQDRAPGTLDQAILPLAVQAVGVIIDWLASMPGVDSRRVGCTGISWGGYLTWLIGIHEPRVRAIVPVYGCGGLFAEERGWMGGVTACREAYRELCDPLTLAGRVLAPVAYLGAGTDFFGWPHDADRLLDRVPVAARRCWAPTLDHALLPGQSALAVAWMRQYLADGPTVPQSPTWHNGEAVWDRSFAVDSVEEWWSPCRGPDDTRCWWPGHAPSGWASRLAVVHYTSGLSLSTPVLTAEGSIPHNTDLGTRWPNLRAGLGWHWCLGGTQLHGNRTVVSDEPGGGVRLRGERGDGFLFQGLADPRWNRECFAGMEIQLTGVPAGHRVILTLRGTSGPFRPEWQGSCIVDAAGRIRVDRHTVALPAEVPWSQVVRLACTGLPDSDFGITAITRLNRSITSTDRQ